jgi:hypothetical protein
MSTRSNGSGQMTVRVSPVEQQSMTQVQHKLDSPTYVISDDREIREGQEAWSRLNICRRFAPVPRYMIVSPVHTARPRAIEPSPRRRASHP